MNKTISALILSILIGSMIFGMIEMVNGASESENSMGCKNLYWIDSTHKKCSQQEFCGAFMYYGLQTFESKEQCLRASEPLGESNCACTMDAKMCFDGSYVGRVCPDCKFAECENDSKKYFNLSNGRKAEIKIMPSTASEKAIERLGELNFTIELKEVGNAESMLENKQPKPVYELTGEKQGRFLGIFKIMASEKVQVDAETGEVIKVIKPWWTFLATRI